MTLILTLLTPTWVIQVSDRRVTRSDSHGDLYDDLNNKAVVYLSLAALGYTGAAEVSGKRTDRWITEILAPTAGLGEAIDVLRSRATAEFAQPALQQRTLGIVMAGWDPVGDDYIAFCAVVSNCFEKRPPDRRLGYGAGVVSSRRDEFNGWAFALQPGVSHLVFSAGQHHSLASASSLSRNVRRALDRNAQPETLVRLLAEEIWRCASRNPRVGTSLMAVCVPKSAAKVRGALSVIGGPPREESITSMYLPGPEAGPIYYLANLAGAGAAFTDAQVEPLG